MMTKLTFLSLLSLVMGLLGCGPGQPADSSSAEAGMFRVTILYPAGEGQTFDMNYYQNRHMPMVAGLLGDNLKFYEIDEGVSGRTSTDEAPFAAIGSFYVSDAAKYSETISQNRDAIVGDFKNYTTIQPVVQISRVTYVGDSTAREARVP